MLPQGVSGASEGGQEHEQQPAAQEAAGESSKPIVVDLTEESGQATMAGRTDESSQLPAAKPPRRWTTDGSNVQPSPPDLGAG